MLYLQKREVCVVAIAVTVKAAVANRKTGCRERRRFYVAAYRWEGDPCKTRADIA